MVNGLFEEAEAFEGAEATVVAGAEGAEGAGVLTVEALFFLGAIVSFFFEGSVWFCSCWCGFY